MQKRNAWQNKSRHNKRQLSRQTRNQAVVKRLALIVKQHESRSASSIATSSKHRRQALFKWLQVGLLLLVLAALLLLTGCASGTPPIAPQPRPCPASLTADCPAPLAARSGTLPDLLSNHIEAMELYAQCRDQLSKLAQCTRKE